MNNRIKRILKNSIAILIVLILGMIILPHIRLEAATISTDTVYGRVNGKQKKIDLSKDLEKSNEGVKNTFVGVMAQTGKDADGNYSILHQPNVMCIDKNTEVGDWERYKVGDITEVQDPILAYIFSHLPTANMDGIVCSGYDGYLDSAQVATWMYLNKYSSSADSKSLLKDRGALGTITTSNLLPDSMKDYVTKEKVKTLVAQGTALLEAAEDYANNLKNAAAPSISVKLLNNGNLEATVKGNYKSFKLKVNGVQIDSYTPTSSTTKITINKASFSGTNVTVSVEGILNEYSASYRILKPLKEKAEKTSAQRLLVVSSYSDEAPAEDIATTIRVKPDISLQKYIVQVNGDSLTSTQTSMRYRYYKKTYDRDTYVSNNVRIKDGSIQKVYEDSNNEIYKQNTAVKIAVGDTVTYKIYVYNNSKVKAENITVADRLPFYYEDNQAKVAVSEEKSNIVVKNSKGETVNWTKSTETTKNSNGQEYTYTYITWGTALNGDTCTYFDVTLKFDKLIINRTLENMAKIEGTTPTNSPSCRTRDRDYVQIGDVSLQKYITQVKNASGTVKATYNAANNNNRANKKAGDNSNEKINKTITASGTTKTSNPVKIEVGDKVTYRIYVYNNSMATITNVPVRDTIPSNATITEIKMNGNSSVSWTRSGTTNTYLYTITEDIASGGNCYFDITLQFTTYKSGKIANTAYIKTDYNYKSGTYRTTDYDYVEMALPDVSLQKYITEVKNSSGGTVTYSRANRKAGSASKSEITKTIGSSGTNKIDDSVKIEVGDWVTYNITVYNNSKTMADTVKICDTLPIDYIDQIQIDKNNTGTWTTYYSNGTTFNKIKSNGGKWEISISDLETGSPHTIKIKLHYNTYTADRIKNQVQITSTTPSNDPNYRTVDYDYVKMTMTNVSLQKYIIDVNGKGLTGKTSLTNRVDRKTKEDDYASVKDEIYYDYSTNNKKVTASNYYKRNNIVNIAQGDAVTYQIDVYNNSETTNAEDIKVIDRLPYYTKNNTINVAATIIEVTDKNGNPITYNSYTDDKGYPYISWNTQLNAKANTYFDVKLEFKDLIYGVLDNWAKIDSTTPSNLNEYRTLDRDYVQMIDVSLQKYITRVTDSANNEKDLSNLTNLKERINTYIENADNKRGGTTYRNADMTGKYKQSNPVEIETKDKVTYRIYVYNNSPVIAKNVTIHDTIPSNAKITAIKMNGESMSINNWTKSGYDYSYKIASIPARENGKNGECYFDITLQFTSYKTGNIENKAYIDNAYAYKSKTYRTEDYDYVKMEKPEVSLQKYITKVNGNPLTENQTSITDRKDTYIQSTAKGKTTYAGASMKAGMYKYSNPVLIQENDKVTYTIEVYNNSSTKLTDILIYDKIPSNAEIKTVSKVSWRLQSGSTDIYEFIIPEIPASSQNAVGNYSFDITLQFKSYDNSNIKANKAYIDSYKSNTYRIEDYDYVKMEQSRTDVSLQKYILSVNGADTLTTTQTSMTDRINKKTKEDESNGNVFKNGSYKGIYYNYTNNNTITASNNYKRNNVVKIKVGDTVTYRIHVYNNSETDATSITVRDRLPFYYTTSERDTTEVAVKKDNIVVKKKNSSSNVNFEFETITIEGCEYECITWNTSLAGKGNTYFDVTLKFHKFIHGTLENRADIESTVPTNSKNYRTLDRDYVQIGDVSLQKYIIGVTDSNDNPKTLSNITDLAERENTGKRTINEQTHYNEEKVESFKYNNPVSIELDDKVTYKIEVYNNSESVAKNVTIYETIPSNAVVCGDIKKNGSSKVEHKISENTYSWEIDEMSSDEKCYFVITLQFTSYNSGIISNRAYIDNAYAYKSKTYRTEDYDYVTMKQPDVSLQKYIIGVTDSKDNPKTLSNLTSMTNRIDKKTRDNESNANVKNDIYYNHTKGRKVTASDSYKLENAVKIVKGDKVTYRIYVYNNSDAKATNITVRDRLPYYNLANDTTKAGVAVDKNNIVVTQGDLETNVIYASDKISIDGKEYECITWNTSLAGKGSTYFDVTLTFNRYLYGTLENRADIKSTTPTNLGNYRTLDRDYVRIGNVSLQKYIIGVTDSNDNSKTLSNITDLAKRENTGNRTDNEQTYYKAEIVDSFKHANPVSIELGDKVTYSVYVYNNSMAVAENVTIFDTIPENAIIDKITAGDSDTNIKRKWINLEGTTTYQYEIGSIPAGDLNGVGSCHFKITLQFTSYKTGNIENKAYIDNEYAYRSTGFRVTDYDYVEMETSKPNVSLQKYITKVNGDPLTDNQTSITDREDTYIKSNAKGKTTHSGATMKTGMYKYSNPVAIKKGDEVTYKIVVYNNNSSAAVRNVEINEKIPTAKGITTTSKKIDGVTIPNSEWKDLNVTDGYHYYGYTIASIPKGGKVEIEITLKYNNTFNEILDNTVELTEDNKTSDEYRIVDRDYVFIPDVSLQKYVTYITKPDGTVTNIKNQRADWLTSQNEDNDGAKEKDPAEGIEKITTYKQDNPVAIKVGDEVTYKIIVYNNSPVAVSNIRIREQIPKNKGIEITSIKQGDIETITEWEQKNASSATVVTYEYTINDSISANGGTLVFEVTLKYTEYFSNILNNTAYFPSTENKKSDEFRTVDRDYVFISDVSLQKYITKVNGKGIDTDRENWLSDENETKDGAKKHPSKGKASVITYKKADPVLIEVGDEVTYKIIVYNNSASEVKNVRVREQIPENKGIEIVSIKRDNVEVEWKDIVSESTTYDYYGYTIDSIPKNDNVEFEITLKYTTYSTNIINNTAYIPDFETQKSDEYRILDRDYIKMKQYSVSLEKYVTKVNNVALTNNSCTNKNREGKPIYGVASVKDIKQNDPVEVEIGDKVTYTIKLTNNGTDAKKYGIIKHLVVTDMCPDGLEYVSSSDEVTANEARNTFTYEGEIGLGISTTFTITYEVTESAANITDLIENTAEVSTELKNKDNITVKDKDGKDNTDSDWIKVSDKYGVSLLKYVSKVNGNPIKDEERKKEEYRRNEALPSEDEGEVNYSKYKKDNKVPVEYGDTVTFTIEVKNTNEKDVLVTKIIERYDGNARAELTYKSASCEWRNCRRT